MTNTTHTKFKRVLLKLSGEALMGTEAFGIQHEACQKIASAVSHLQELGVQVGIVIGGGNIFRGAHALSFGFERTPADHIGMMATVINGLVLQQALSAAGVESTVMSALSCGLIVETYQWQKAMQYLESGTVVIFVGGTSNPYFTTDTAAALRASEIHAEILLKATKVSGVFSADPKKDPHAKPFKKLSYDDVLTKKLGVMDATAIALCRESEIPIYVFDVFEQDSLIDSVTTQTQGTLISEH